MAFWIFQGNPKVYDIDTYLKKNEVADWQVRQKHHLDEIHIGDKVFIWRSDGGIKNSGGIIGLGDIVSEPYAKEGGMSVDIKILEYRLTEDEGMLFRHELKEIPEIKNLLIFRLSQLTNYKLTDEEFQFLMNLWKSPSLLQERLELSSVENHLLSFKAVAKEWFEDNKFLYENHAFFEKFRDPEYLNKIEWEDIQQLGIHINAFNMALARKRALGNINEPLEKYRESFLYLLQGDEPIAQRIDNLNSNEQYKLFGFGESVISELVGYLFPKEYCPFNQRDRVAVENILGINPGYPRGATFGEKFIFFQKGLVQNNIVEKYLRIVGKQTDLPIYYEIDQFFSYLFHNFRKKDSEEAATPAKIQYWLLAAGEAANKWEDFKENQLIAIGWKELGDLQQYGSKREITEALKEIHNYNHNPNNDVLANYQFCKEMKIGDYVFIKRGNKTIIGYGKITSDYKFDTSRDDYKSIREVEWLNLGEWDLEGNPFPTKTLTNITPFSELVEDILKVVVRDEELPLEGESNGGLVINDPPGGYQPYTIENIRADVFMSEEKIDEIVETLDYKKNIILQGPPGVGKTYIAKKIAYLHNGVKDDSKIEMIQFHQSYTYEDFIRGYKPTADGAFKLKDGIFYSFCQKANENPAENFYMIIDEINRGNLSKIFGELMMLIEADKRGKDFEVKLTYTEKDEAFYLPENLYIIGTMNTADRSLALVDYALRRRFAFITIEPGFNTPQFKEYLMDKGLSLGFIEKLIVSMNELNQEIVDDKLNLGKGYEIGHSYFCPVDDEVLEEEKWFRKIIKLEIEPLLNEYWFDNSDKVSEILARLQ